MARSDKGFAKKTKIVRILTNMDEPRIRDAIDAMNRISSAWRRCAQARLVEFGITIAQYELIALLRRRGAMPPSAAADWLDWDRPSLTIVARTCLASGWIRRGRSPGDRRSHRLELSGPGEELLDRIERRKPFSDGDFGDPFDVIGSEERAELARLVDRVARRARDIWER